MIQQVFLDTNIVLDFILKREPFIKQVDDIFKLKDEYALEFYISSLTVANIAYYINKLNKKPHLYVARLLYWFQVVDLTMVTIQQTVISEFDDFEERIAILRCCFSRYC